MVGTAMSIFNMEPNAMGGTPMGMSSMSIFNMEPTGMGLTAMDRPATATVPPAMIRGHCHEGPSRHSHGPQHPARRTLRGLFAPERSK